MNMRFWESRATRAAREAAYWRAEMEEPGSAQLVEQFQAWLHADPANLAAYGDSDRIAATGQRMTADTAAIRENKSRRYVKPMVATGLTLAVACVGALWLNNAASPAFAIVSNEGPMEKTISLKDGSVVTLAAHTTIEVDVAPPRHEVHVLSGRARFRVRLPAAAELAIATTAGSVRTNNSVIDVSFIGGDMGVRLLNGTASVGSTDGVATSAASGDALVIRDGAVTRRSNARDQPLAPLARVNFDDVPISQVLALANRNGRPTVIADTPTIAALRVTAVLDLRDTRSLARKLAAAENLRVVERNGALVLMR